MDALAPCRLLVIDDCPEDVDLVRLMLHEAGARVDLVRVDSLKAIEQALRDPAPWDLCLIDWVMPDLTTPEVLRVIENSRQPDLPFVVWSATNDPKVAFVACHALGARAFVPKSEIHRLPSIVDSLRRRS